MHVSLHRGLMSIGHFTNHYGAHMRLSCFISTSALPCQSSRASWLFMLWTRAITQPKQCTQSQEQAWTACGLVSNWTVRAFVILYDMYNISSMTNNTYSWIPGTHNWCDWCMTLLNKHRFCLRTNWNSRESGVLQRAMQTMLCKQ